MGKLIRYEEGNGHYREMDRVNTEKIRHTFFSQGLVKDFENYRTGERGPITPTGNVW